MASPPQYASSPTAMSPPYPTPASIPNKKRSSSFDTTGKPPAMKRRKASTLSQSSVPVHPLRQTSFPPEARSPHTRSPSVDALSHVSGSAVSGTASGVGGASARKKRGRKLARGAGKTGDDGGANDQASSVAGGKAATNVSGQGVDKEAEEDEDDDKAEMALEDVVARTQEQKQEEIRLRAMLVEAFDSEQYNRYELWRAAKLSDAVVKRVVNATVSQSVPQMVSTAVKAVAKLFAGELIEEARQVQAEWIRAGEHQSELPTPTPPPPPADSTEEEKREQELDPKRGPLRPDHLRAAWLRYRTSKQSHGVGMQQLWHNQQGSGVERFSARTRKQMFK
ncbi:TAFII28-like protein [Beauveria brongniartii RCEF 3172]|uniref:TAFII28-like protein n=1 Tax=Beauveria brongniartii RCEF 3172 TaxID=1081107 RepID=A0A167A3C8_9HYPO|nr:TAFII28-like protein [Beauveria brongniartii RCEF 3172]